MANISNPFEEDETSRDSNVPSGEDIDKLALLLEDEVNTSMLQPFSRPFGIIKDIDIEAGIQEFLVLPLSDGSEPNLVVNTSLLDPGSKEITESENDAKFHEYTGDFSTFMRVQNIYNLSFDSTNRGGKFILHAKSGLRCVILCADVFYSFFNMGHSNETEEFLGLLIGEIFKNKEGESFILVSAVKFMERLDKRQDRVEICDLQSVNIAEEAEQLSKLTNRHLSIVGWFHTHPHCTPTPSGQDLFTQRRQQSLQSVWVGIIMTSFCHHANQEINEQRMFCFQAEGNSIVKLPICLLPESCISKTISDDMIEHLKRIYNENFEYFRKQEGSKLAMNACQSNTAIFKANTVAALDSVHTIEIYTVPLVQVLFVLREKLKIALNKE